MNLRVQVEPLYQTPPLGFLGPRRAHSEASRFILYNNGSNEPPDHHAYCRESQKTNTRAVLRFCSDLRTKRQWGQGAARFTGGARAPAGETPARSRWAAGC